MLAHLFRATPQQTLAGENVVRKPVERADGRQLENHTSQGHQRYETRNASTTNSIRQLWRGVPGDEVGQVLQRVVEVVLPERRELEVLAHLGRDR